MTGTATHAHERFAPGDLLDRYELLCPLAAGGMASVWVARLRGKHGFEKLVAIKTILPRFAANGRFREMFLEEARIASRIEHPNVVRVLDLGEAADVLYLAMEYVDGDPLSKLHRSCQKQAVELPTGIVLRVVADACAGLHEAHELADSRGRLLGIVHRDISPHNVLVSTKGVVKLIDFGIAKSESTGGADAESGVLKGKIQYMAPEQALGRPTDRRADVWAVGAIVYHLVAGRAPFEWDTPLATIHLLESGLPPAPLPPEIHPAVAAVVRKALSPEPDRRYGTAAELRDAIERAMVVAQVTTSSSQVAAFTARYLGERAQRRRDNLERAIAAIAERTRMAGARAAASLAGDATHAAPGWPEPVGRGSATPARASVAPRHSDPPAATSSYATLGSAALDARASAPPKRRRSLVAVSAFVLGFAGVTGVSMTVLRPRRPTDVAAAAVAAAPPAPSVPAALLSPASATAWTVPAAPPIASPTGSSTSPARADGSARRPVVRVARP